MRNGPNRSIFFFFFYSVDVRASGNNAVSAERVEYQRARRSFYNISAYATRHTIYSSVLYLSRIFRKYIFRCQKRDACVEFGRALFIIADIFLDILILYFRISKLKFSRSFSIYYTYSFFCSYSISIYLRIKRQLILCIQSFAKYARYC